jgi:hypothetical protein
MKRIAFGLAVVFAGCVTNNGPEDPEDLDIQPRAGLWSYDDTITSNSCPSSTPTGEFGAFAIDQVTDSGFRVLADDGTDPFHCDLSNGNFDCPDRGEVVEDLRPTADAVVTATGVAEGSFSSPTSGRGTQTVTVTCVGSACDALGFPCSIKASFEIDAD